MTYEELVKKLKTAYAKADASAIEEHVAVQFNVTGEGEGALYLEVSDGKIDIQPYEYYDRDAIVVTGADTLVDIAAGKVGIVDAYNQNAPLYKRVFQLKVRETEFEKNTTKKIKRF